MSPARFLLQAMRQHHPPCQHPDNTANRLAKAPFARLARSQAAGRLPSGQHLLDDDDLRCVRDEPWFAELLSAARDEADSDLRSPHAAIASTLLAENR
jgi:hypothetical protein